MRRQEEQAKKERFSARAAEKKEREALLAARRQKIEHNLEIVAAKLRKDKASSPATSIIEAVVRAKAPSLLEDPAYKIGVEAVVHALNVVLGSEFAVRNPHDWTPTGKGRDRLFRSLCDHCIAKYKTPPFLWRLLLKTGTANRAYYGGANYDLRNAEVFHHIVVRLATGSSLFDLVKEGIVSAPLTKKMCHEVMQTSVEGDFETSVRWAQIKSEGGSPRFLKFWMSTTKGPLAIAGTSEARREEEDFNFTVLRFFARNPMFGLEEIPGVLDYIRNQRAQNPEWSLKGRTSNSLYRDSQRWHDEIADQNRNRKYRGKTVTEFKPSGFQGRQDSVTKNTPAGEIHETWRVFEILTSADLWDEGRAQSHCVGSYTSMVASGATSIWSITKKDNTGNWRMATVEVDNRCRTIRQARTRFNARIAPDTHKCLARWAAQNGLSLGSWL